LWTWVKRESAVILRKRLAVQTAKVTISAAEHAMTWAKQRGVRVLFVLQPNIMTLAKKSLSDSWILDATARNLLLMLNVAYHRYRDWSTTSPNVVSAVHIFDGEKPSPYISDWAHVNSRGNELIAKFIFDELKTRDFL
jgi:hypothetical protein